MSKCPECGWKEIDNEKRELVLTEEMIPNTDMSDRKRTLHIIVNEKV